MWSRAWKRTAPRWRIPVKCSHAICNILLQISTYTRWNVCRKTCGYPGNRSDTAPIVLKLKKLYSIELQREHKQKQVCFVYVRSSDIFQHYVRHVRSWWSPSAHPSSITNKRSINDTPCQTAIGFARLLTQIGKLGIDQFPIGCQPVRRAEWYQNKQERGRRKSNGKFSSLSACSHLDDDERWRLFDSDWACYDCIVVNHTEPCSFRWMLRDKMNRRFRKTSFRLWSWQLRIVCDCCCLWYRHFFLFAYRK